MNKETLDQEWVELISQAKQIGLSMKEIQMFLNGESYNTKLDESELTDISQISP